ncbi:MAG: hypothetical protein ACYDEQ_08060 [Desulfocucumaceae bacterium]
MRKFLKGILAGTVLGALAGVMMKPSRKPVLRELMDAADQSSMGRRAGKIMKGMAGSMDKIVKK